MAIATDAPTHLLTPQRVDQLVREHLDPPAYPAYPAEFIAAYERLCERAEQLAAHTHQLTIDGPHIFDAATPTVQRHVALVDDLDQQTQQLEEQITSRLAARRAVLEQLYRELPEVAAVPQLAPQQRYFSDQQWLSHVDRALAAAPMRSDRAANIRAVAEALAQHARSDGIFLAGVVDVQDSAGIAPTTWKRAYNWLVEQGLAHTVHPARQLTQLERALAVGSEKHAHVRRWRAVIQLQHTGPTVLKPAKWSPPARRAVQSLHPLRELITTGRRPVDNGATRRTAAPTSRPATTKKQRRRFRKFDTLTTVLLQRLQRLPGWPPAVKACSVLPHLYRFAHNDVEPAALIAAMTDAHHRGGLNPHARSIDPTRRAIWALTRLDLDDVRAVQTP